MASVIKQTEVAALASLVGRIKTLSAFAVAIWVSVFVHVTILTIHFEPELKKFADKLPSLDVVLVNAKTKQAPDKAELLAKQI